MITFGIWYVTVFTKNPRTPSACSMEIWPKPSFRLCSSNYASGIYSLMSTPRQVFGTSIFLFAGADANFRIYNPAFGHFNHRAFASLDGTTTDSVRKV